MAFTLPLQSVRQEPGYWAWLDFRPRSVPEGLPGHVVVSGSHPVLETASSELSDGLESLFGTLRELPGVFVLSVSPSLPADGFSVVREGPDLLLTGGNERGILYGVFEVLRALALGSELPLGSFAPAMPMRLLNHWDNPDGSIERGYAGPSLFFSGDSDSLITEDLDRVRDYARLLASLGINAISVNNVNTDARVYDSAGLKDMATLANVLRSFGIQMILAVAFDSPQRMGELTTFDPLAPQVVSWWEAKVAEIYRFIPDLLGVVVKADSEGRLGPSAYERTHADAANMIARALKPFGGVIFYRGFVYNHRMDWHDRSLDRAKAAYDNFKPLDGQFDENVIIQIKNGPIDFQVREPVSPSFAALERTNTILEVMVTQEYLGQQRHTVYEAPWWKDSLDFDFGSARLMDLVKKTGMVAVCGAGRNANWLGNHLAQANLYAYGRLTWDPSLSSEAIAEEWVRLTFGSHPLVVEEITHILMRSWPVYENYTGNLGIGGLTDIIHIHYGPAPLSSEHNGWGQWHRSDEKGTGMDRTMATGTGFTAQYPPLVATRFEELETCPEELLLFFHHVPYTYVLKSGKTVIQHLYDAHYEGAEEVEEFVHRWQRLEGKIDQERYAAVLDQLEYQAGHALVWRDSVCHWFARFSGIADAHDRVGHEPGRVEAEDLELVGFEVVEVEPWEAASGSRVIEAPEEAASGHAIYRFDLEAGGYDIHTWYFDRPDNAAYHLSLNGQIIDKWIADRELPSDKLDAHTRTRRVTRGVHLTPGDRLTWEGYNDGRDRAALDCMDFKRL